LRAVLARHSAAAAEKFIQEVLWRTYWKGWLETRPIVWAHYRRDLDAAYVSVARDADLARRLAEATEGRTGNAAFDAWSRELVETNYLHNHARMWFASIWIFTLQLPWELGADFFMRHLLCGDPASNTLSWRWVAGLQTKGKTYLATRENIRRYTNGRLDPGPHLATEASAIVGPSYGPGSVPALDLKPQGERTLFIVHDEDAGIESLALHGLGVVTSIGLLAARGRSPHPVASAVVDFARGAIADALARAPHGDDGTIVELDPTVKADVEAASRSVLARVRAQNANVVAFPFAPVGPVRDALSSLAPLLVRDGMRVIEIGREFDATVWPYATRGFFNLKEKIPRVLATLGIA
jgi:deoxyribodipyrimidine photo-lyase